MSSFKNKQKKGLRISQWFVLCLLLGVYFVSPFGTFQQGKYYQHSSIDEVNQLISDKQEFVIYLARNDCPECQKVDEQLKKQDGKLRQNVYRVETRSEKNVSDLKAFIKQNDVKSVPTFLKIDDINKINKVSFSNLKSSFFYSYRQVIGRL